MTGGDRALVTVATLLGVVAFNACGAGGGEPTGWSAPELLGDGGTSSGSGPDVAASAGGDAVAVWSTWETLLARRFSRGQGWMPVERIDQGAPNSHKAQRVAMDPSGHAIAVWTEPHGVWANRYVAGRGWSGPVPARPWPCG